MNPTYCELEEQLGQLAQWVVAAVLVVRRALAGQLAVGE